MHNTPIYSYSAEQLNDNLREPALEELEYVFAHVLTKSEQEICELVPLGYKNWQIAWKLNKAEATVKRQITSIFNKTGIDNRLDLAMKYNEYKQAVTVKFGPPEDNTLMPVARFRLSENNSLPYTIPLIFKKQSFTIGRFDVLIGRKQRDFEFEQTTIAVSRLHAEIQMLSSGFTITDENSTAGTFLNGERLIPEFLYPLQDGDLVSFGTAGANYVFEV